MLAIVPLYPLLAVVGAFSLLWLASAIFHRDKRSSQRVLLIAAYILLLEVALTLYVRITGGGLIGGVVVISLLRGGAAFFVWPIAAIGALGEALKAKKPPARQSAVDPPKVNTE